MNLVDSSAWLEFLADGPNAGQFREVVGDAGQLLVPTIVLFEVFKRLLAQRGEEDALKAAAYLQRGHVVPLDAETALAAAGLSLELRLPMADSLILATARERGAIVWTQDADFRHIEGVRYFERQV